MTTYAILCNPGHNRVYFEASLKLSVSEFLIASKKMQAEIENIKHENISGIIYFTFNSNMELCSEDIKIISGLSFIYAIFEIMEIDNNICLKPIARTNRNYVDESISSILKYTGKTNEIFTRMLINIAFYSMRDVKINNPVKLLDPVAGKGTTLYEGLIKGFDVHGIEIGDKVVNESYHYLKRFFETGKYKHTSKIIKFSGPNKSFSAKRHEFIVAEKKEDDKNSNKRTVEIIAGSSIYADKYYKKNYFDIIVGDLPYGVQHGNVTNEKQSSLTRNPTELLNSCLDSWIEVLRYGGCMTLAWNSYVISRDKMIKIFNEKGMTVKNSEEYTKLEHMVDKSIKRDIITGLKVEN